MSLESLIPSRVFILTSNSTRTSYSGVDRSCCMSRGESTVTTTPLLPTLRTSGGAAQDRARALVGKCAVAQREAAVYQHVLYTRGVLVRRPQRAALGDGLGVEHHQVGPRAVAHDATIGDTQTARRQLRETVDTFRKRERRPLAHEAAQVVRRPGICAEEALLRERSIDCQGGGIRLRHTCWVEERLLELVLRVDATDHQHVRRIVTRFEQDAHQGVQRVLVSLLADRTEVLADPLGRAPSFEQLDALPLVHQPHLVKRLSERVILCPRGAVGQAP